MYVQGVPVFPHSLAGIGIKPGRSEVRSQQAELDQLDQRVRTISGTLTQDTTPRLGPDLFRLIDEELSEEERSRYPVSMLHNAYHHLLQKDEEIACLQHELQRLREAHAKAKDEV